MVVRGQYDNMPGSSEVVLKKRRNLLQFIEKVASLQGPLSRTDLELPSLLYRTVFSNRRFFLILKTIFFRMKKEKLVIMIERERNRVETFISSLVCLRLKKRSDWPRLPLYKQI